MSQPEIDKKELSHINVMRFSQPPNSEFVIHEIIHKLQFLRRNVSVRFKRKELFFGWKFAVKLIVGNFQITKKPSLSF